MKKTEKIFTNDNFLKVASLLIAIVLWVFVSTTITPEMDVVVSNVPVNVSLTGTSAEAFGLEVVEGADRSVSVTVRGKRHIVGNIKVEDVMVNAQVSSISDAGVYDIELKGEKTDITGEFEVISVNPGSVSLTFDRVKSKKFPVETVSKGITVPDGYVMAKTGSSVTEVIVSGTEEDLARVSRVVANVATTGELSKTVEEEVNLALLDESGKEITSHKMKLSKTKTTVSISVLKIKVVPLAVEYINVPTGLKTSQLPAVLSVNKLTVAGPAEVVDSTASINVGYIDMSKILPGSEFNFDLVLPPGFVCLDDVTSVKVTFPQSSLATKWVRIQNIRVTNVPDGYKASMVSYSVNNVQIVGTNEDLASVTGDDLVAEIDLSKLDFVNGNNTLKTVVLAGGKCVFASGGYTAIVKIEKK